MPTEKHPDKMMMMMMMKNPTLLVAFVVLFSSLVVLSSSNSFVPDKCCFEYFPTPVPKRRVVSFKHTDRQCPKEAVVFTMSSGIEICVNPSVPWVKNIIEARGKILAKKGAASASEVSD